MLFWDFFIDFVLILIKWEVLAQRENFLLKDFIYDDLFEHIQVLHIPGVDLRSLVDIVFNSIFSILQRIHIQNRNRVVLCIRLNVLKSCIFSDFKTLLSQFCYVFAQRFFQRRHSICLTQKVTAKALVCAHAVVFLVEVTLREVLWLLIERYAFKDWIDF